MRRLFLCVTLATLWQAGAAALTLDDVNLGEHVSGPELTTAQMRGKVVLIDFWGTECPPCIAELPGYQALYAKHQNEGFHIAALERQRHPLAEVKAAMTQHPVIAAANAKFQVTAGETTNVAGRFVPMLPVNFLFGPDGQMVAASLHDNALAAEVQVQVDQTWTKLIDVGAPMKLKELAAKLKNGQRLMETLSELAVKRRDAKDPEEQKEATKLMFAIFAAAYKKFELAEAMQATNPVGAYYKFKTLGEDLNGTKIGERAEKEAYTLKNNDRVMREHQAEAELKQVIALIVSFKGNSQAPDFRANNREGLQLLETECKRIYARFKDTVAGQHLTVINQEFQFNLE